LTWALEELANFNKNNQLIVAACNEGLPATLLRCRAKNHLHLNKILTSAAGILRAYGRRIGRDAVLAGARPGYSHHRLLQTHLSQRKPVVLKSKLAGLVIDQVIDQEHCFGRR